MTSACPSHIEILYASSIIVRSFSLRRHSVAKFLFPMVIYFKAALHRYRPTYIINFLSLDCCLKTLISKQLLSICYSSVTTGFYPRDAMLARVIAIATCLSVRFSGLTSRILTCTELKGHCFVLVSGYVC